MKKIFIILSFIVFNALKLFSQETGYGPGYRTMLMNNPALPGVNDAGVLKLSYLNFYPGHRFNLHSFYVSYDTYINALHGGIGIWLTDDYLGGIINDTRGGFSYAYSLKAGDELYINAGLSAGVFYRGFDFSDAVLPDMIDPLSGVSALPGETLVPSSRTVFDVGAGFLLMYGSFFGGLSLSHLSQPYLSQAHNERLMRKLNIISGYNIILDDSHDIGLKPSLFMEAQSGSVFAGAGTSLESRAIAVNVIVVADNSKNLDMQTGFSLKAGNLGLFYSYRFNISSWNELMPVSVMHQTGLTFSLNAVNKRNEAGTISLPEL